MNPTERNWGMTAHLATLSLFIVPFGNLLGPLTVWLLRRDRSAFVAAHGKEALNFNITLTCGFLVCLILLRFSLGVLFAVMLFVFWLVMTTIAAIKANEGQSYHYPFTLRLVK